MGVVSIDQAWPAAGQPFTIAELDRMPDDGRRYELLDGVLVVSPRPTTVHQVAAYRVAAALGAACPADWQVVPEPAVVLSQQTEFDPDVVVSPLVDLGGAKITRPPLLVVEIRSPSTALFDLNAKKAAYQGFGVESYWIVLPDLGKPELIAFQLRRGQYEQVAQVSGDEVFAAVRPFPVEVVPSRLVAGLR
jgi:Uma2 family endonuclease